MRIAKHPETIQHRNFHVLFLFIWFLWSDNITERDVY